MSQVRTDRWLNLEGTPAFLAAIRPGEIERGWWRPLATLALLAPVGFLLAIIGYLTSGLINTWLIQALVYGEQPSWPANLVAAARSSRVTCKACLLGGITETVLVAGLSLAVLFALLVCAVLIYRRPARTWITAAPRFRWRLFWIGLVAFSLVLGAAASIPEALHGWPDKPVFLKDGEAVRIQMAYLVVMLIALPLAAAFEEVLCRGWLLQVTGAFTHNLPAILLLNSLVFSLLHVDPDTGRYFSRAALGMALSWAALRSGGLEIGIGIHAANNLVILLLAQTLQQSETTGASSPGSVAVNLAVAAATVLTVEAVAQWGPLRRWSGLDLGDEPDQSLGGVQRANSTLAAP